MKTSSKKYKQFIMEMKKKCTVIILFITLALGIILPVLPVLERKQNQEIQDKKINMLEQEICEEQTVLFSTNFPEITHIKPTVDRKQITDTIESSIIDEIGILKIDKIELKLPVVSGVAEEQLKTAVGWVNQTTPIGEKGNAIIAGHRSFTYGRHFNRLAEIEVGDVVEYITKTGLLMKFKVTDILTVAPDNPIIFESSETSAQLTLYTCTPIFTATHRLLIRAERIY